MKHLLILISILLLSSPLIGDNHKGETLYQWGEYPDFFWMGFGEKDTHPKYLGQVKDGKPNGIGIMTFHRRGKILTKYVGEWKDGKYHGQGTHSIYLSPGDLWSVHKAKGEWKNGKSWNVIYYDMEGEIVNKVVNGKTIPQQTPTKNN